MAYSQIPSSESLDFESDDSEKGKNLRPRKHWIIITTWLLSLACTYALTRWYYLSRPIHIRPHIETVSAFDYNSPVYDDIDLHLDTVRPNSDLFDETSTIYRQNPSPATDAAWLALEKHMNPVTLSKSDMQRMGLSTDGAVRWPDDPTGNTYLGSMDVFHLVHCLNVLRKVVWSDFYRDNGTKLHPVYWPHRRHCLEVLRQEIMCTGSLNVYRLEWLERQEAPFPDFNMERKCRRWDDIVEWYEKHQIGDENVRRFKMLRKPGNDHAVPLSPAGSTLLDALEAWDKNHSEEYELPGHVLESRFL